MRLASPWFLIVLPLLMLLLLAAYRRREGRFRYSSTLLLQALPRNARLNPRLVLYALRGLALTFLVLALARPQSGRHSTEVASEGLDIMLALDTSGSMQALDLKLDDKPAQRVDVVKRVAANFVEQRPADRIGVVVFGETAYLQCPLTLDHGLLVNLMDQIHVGIAGDSTAIGDAIGVSVNHMKKIDAKSKVIVLLTDGQNNSGMIPPLKAAEIAKTFGIKIYTIGVGVEGEAPFLIDTPFGKRVVYQKADLDEPTLKQIAEITGARFFRAKDTDTLQNVYREIDHLEKREVKVKEYLEYDERYVWFAYLGLFLLLGEVVLSQTLLRKIP